MAKLSDSEKKIGNKDFEVSLYNSSYFSVSNKNKVTFLSNGWHTCFGNTIIDVKKSPIIKQVEWTIKVDYSVYRHIMIGISRDPWNFSSYGGAYATMNSYMYYACNGQKYQSSSASGYGQAVNGQGPIIVILDVKNKKLSFNINGNDLGVAFDNITEGQYRLAIDMNNANDIITIDSERITPNHFLGATVESLINCNDGIKKSIETCIKYEKNVSSVPFDQLIQTSKILSDVEKQKEILEENLKKLDDYTEKLQTILSSNLHPDLSNWSTWTPEEIVKWLITLDGGIYNVYAKSFLDALKENQMSGEDLVQVTKNDLFLFGVKVFKHRVQLLNHFTRLANGGGDLGEGGGTVMDNDNDENDEH